ncbi:F-box protein At3g07870-like [Cannabis sativa]|uniref:F-box protein At3g07870-like n=1 Tax=Cannabis sativa TaxID=3483 RepID=UPI0029CA72F1|nr:F-box protein At3g07870-like [Cannabis sativa]XP_060958157.1 F-box protein At3g07870-like [Cannabis sativa]
MAVKRKRTSIVCDVDKSHFDDELIQMSGSVTISDIPDQILVQIFFGLTTISIVFCKSVCKKWRNLISESHFAKLHFAQAKPQFLIRTLDSIRISRTLYLVEPDIHGGYGFESYFDLCRLSLDVEDGYYISPHMKLNAKLKIPVRNAEIVLQNQDDPVMKKKNRCLNLKPKDHKYKIVNSCNGLLCLSEPSRNDPVAVCNPVTGEFMNLPPSNCDDENLNDAVDCGLGFSPESNQYKVIRVFHRNTYVRRPEHHCNAFSNYTNTYAVVHTLGTDSWRSVDNAPHSKFKLGFPTYLNGALYGLYVDHGRPNYLISFDFDNEKFELLNVPQECEDTWITDITMGVISGDLCLCDRSDLSLDVWILKSFSSDTKAWSKLFTMDWDWPYILYQPVHGFNSGALLIFLSNNGQLMYKKPLLIDPSLVGFHPTLCYSDPTYIDFCGLKTRYEIIVHTPSFISLRDTFAGNNNVEILNVNTRCGSLKLRGETKDLILKGDSYPDAVDSDTFEIEEVYWTNYWWKKKVRN